MRLILLRTYFPEGTSGKVFYNDKLICESLELPWKNNEKQISCIPEGYYTIGFHYHPYKGSRLEVRNVAGRSGILIHTGNDVLKDSKGCILPVSKCTSATTGVYSRVALERLEDLIYPALEAEEKVELQIISSAWKLNDRK